MLSGIDNLPEIEIREKRILLEVDPGGIHDSSGEWIRVKFALKTVIFVLPGTAVE